MKYIKALLCTMQMDNSIRDDIVNRLSLHTYKSDLLPLRHLLCFYSKKNMTFNKERLNERAFKVPGLRTIKNL